MGENGWCEHNSDDFLERNHQNSQYGSSLSGFCRMVLLRNNLFNEAHEREMRCGLFACLSTFAWSDARGNSRWLGTYRSLVERAIIRGAKNCLISAKSSTLGEAFFPSNWSGLGVAAPTFSPLRFFSQYFGWFTCETTIHCRARQAVKEWMNRGNTLNKVR